MNLLCLHDIDSPNIYFLETKKNIIIDGIFTKIIYTHPYFTMNGLYLHLPEGIKTDNHCLGAFMNLYISDKEWCSKLERIEREILQIYSISKRTEMKPSYVLQKQFKMGFLKTYKDSITGSYILKISGVWETQNEYGITYKIIRGVKC